MSLKNTLRNVEDALQSLESARTNPFFELQSCLNQAEMELKDAAEKLRHMIEGTVFLPDGKWHQSSIGFYIWLSATNGPAATILGVPFNMLAIETKGGDTQTAAHPINQEELTALHKAGGTCTGYKEGLVNDRTAVIYLVPFDR